MYKNYRPLKDKTVKVLEAIDGGNKEVLDFGIMSEKSMWSMLFCNTSTPRLGKVEVIAVPFQNGSHECKNIDQAIQIVEWLQDMHNEGCPQ